MFAYGDGLVLRRNRDGRNSEREAALMARVDGPTLGEQLLSGAVSPADGATVLADPHSELHELPWPDAAPGECLLHLALHPLNVILTSVGPMLIDWTNARTGRPGLDVAVTVLVLAQVGLADDAIREVVLPFIEEFVARAATPYAAELPEAVAFRGANPHQTPAEEALLDDAVELTRRWA